MFKEWDTEEVTRIHSYWRNKTEQNETPQIEDEVYRNG